jgi:hypothetical protein
MEYIEIDGIRYNGNDDYRATAALLQLRKALQHIKRAAAFGTGWTDAESAQLIKLIRQAQQQIRNRPRENEKTAQQAAFSEVMNEYNNTDYMVI